ncbi:hypothetical protein EB061_10680, partial [bacterium]|nr:hypothetical protein [bacterium]
MRVKFLRRFADGWNVKLPSILHGISPRTLTKSAFVAVGLLLLWKAGGPAVRELRSSFAMKEFRELGVLGTYRYHFLRFFGHLDDLARMDRENDELIQKVGHLEKRVVLEEARKTERELASLTEVVEEMLKDEAGSELATAFKTISYEIPKNLSYAQLQALGIGYFEKQDFEKSAMIYHHLLNLKEEGRFRTAENRLLSAISWFHLNHLHMAKKEINQAIEAAPEASLAHRNALIWRALVEKRLGKEALSQET